ncbi:5' exonuclease Apollo [Vanrija pseudolonga]|uniref:5' exonuclease Apollo n=1 Tax=Vanrija pseudolonga TaxID=143232 RepID=A0AAF0YF61_9TREE|nr:5' exonuclease Apollo [Vanrija pseudolonga]
MAGLYKFPLIRVDCFTSPRPGTTWLLPNPKDPSLPWTPAPNAQLFLLTHVHSDHLLGLSNSFAGRILCSPDTKRMLLSLEAESNRVHSLNGILEVPKRKYDGLRPRHRVDGNRETLPYGETREFDLGYRLNEQVKVKITLFDANHCPGSTMFLLQSPDFSVLHTGDVRADSPFVESLRRNPTLEEYIGSGRQVERQGRLPNKQRLDRIYLDTSALLGTGDMPDKEVALQDVMQQLDLYPRDTVFFFNIWCFGWEDIVKEVARYFGTVVHVDRYKRSIYKAIASDPSLLKCTTESWETTRFHACERLARCPMCRSGTPAGQAGNKLIVQVVFAEIKTVAWDIRHQEFIQQLSHAVTDNGRYPTTIEVPLARHSLLPELRRLVQLFRPMAISPNTLVPTSRGMDYYLFPQLFGEMLSKEELERAKGERDSWFVKHRHFGGDWLARLKWQEEQIGLLAFIGSFNVEHGDARHPSGSASTTRTDTRDVSYVDQVNRLLGPPVISEGDRLNERHPLVD